MQSMRPPHYAILSVSSRILQFTIHMTTHVVDKMEFEFLVIRHKLLRCGVAVGISCRKTTSLGMRHIVNQTY